MRDEAGTLNPKGYLPQEKHTIQVGIYIAMLARHGIKVSSASLVYISRDKAAVSYTSPPGVFSAPVDQAYIDFFEGHLSRAEDAFDSMLHHAGAKTFDPKAFVADIWRNRPCRCSADYQQYMKLGFFRSDCPFGEKGLCWKDDAKTVPRMLLKSVTAKGQAPLAAIVTSAKTSAVTDDKT